MPLPGNSRVVPCLLIGLIAMLFCAEATAQVESTNVKSKWVIIEHESGASFRGLFVVDENVVWVSGSGGTVLRSVDGGKSFESVGPAEANELDFRDVHAFDADNAIITTAGTPARIYGTADGGTTWEIVFEDERPAAFFDAMSFWDRENGVVFSDPVDGKLLVVKTSDGGKTWSELDRSRQPATLSGEAGFAASGTCLCTNGEDLFIGLGGTRSDGEPANARILKSSDKGETWSAARTPIKSGQASGVFSIIFANRDHGVAVGGTYSQPEDATSNICITDDGGETWKRPESTPRGYRSCATIQRTETGLRIVAVSRAGSDYSDDYGATWLPLDDEVFYAADFSVNGQLGIAVGPDGRIGIWPNGR